MSETMARALPAFELELVPVVASTHPLAASDRPLETDELATACQFVIGRRGKDDPDDDRAVLSPTTWRVAEAGTKHELLLPGLGWGNLPLGMVNRDLAEDRLVRLDVVAFGPPPLRITMHRVVRRDRPLGPAARWRLDHLAACPPDPGTTPCTREAPDAPRAT